MNGMLTLFHAACLCVKLFSVLLVDVEHVEHVLLVAVDHAVEGEDPVEIVVEAHAAEIVVGGLAGIVVEVLAEIVAEELVAVQRIAEVGLAETVVAVVVEVDGLAETVEVDLVGTG